MDKGLEILHPFNPPPLSSVPTMTAWLFRGMYTLRGTPIHPTPPLLRPHHDSLVVAWHVYVARHSDGRRSVDQRGLQPAHLRHLSMD